MKKTGLIILGLIILLSGFYISKQQGKRQILSEMTSLPRNISVNNTTIPDTPASDEGKYCTDSNQCESSWCVANKCTREPINPHLIGDYAPTIININGKSFLVAGYGNYLSIQGDENDPDMQTLKDKLCKTIKCEIFPIKYITVEIPTSRVNMNDYQPYDYGPPPTETPLPKSLSVSVPVSLKDSLEAYYFDFNKRYILGPKGWKGEGVLGTNGNMPISLYPKTGSDESGPRVTFYEVPACWSCALDEAIPFFEEARNEAKNWGFFDIEQTLEGLEYQIISPGLAEYTLPNTEEGLKVKGVIHTKIVNGIITTPVVEMEYKLPEKDTELGDYLLKSNISQINSSQ